MFYSTASLQSLCLMKAVQQFDVYTPELLACLPPTLRRRLLVHLPIVDVCKLEETCVFEEIEAEIIWKELLELHISRYFTALDNFPPHEMLRAKTTLEEKEVKWRDKLLLIITNIVLSRARPSGYFAALRNHGRTFCEKPPGDILAIAPVDIVNFLIAGERVSAVHVSGVDHQEEEEMDDTIVAAMTDYDNEERERYEESFFQYERGEHFLDYCAYKETNEKLQCFPPRYSHYVQESNDCCRLSDEDAVVFLMDKCSFHPHSLFISVSAYSSKCWNETLINQFLKNIVRLSLIFDKYVKGTTEMEQLLTAVLSLSNPILSSLDLSCLVLDNHQLDIPIPDDHLVGDDHLLLLAQFSASSILSSSPLASPLRTLRHLSVDGRFTADGLNQIGTVLSNQPMLTSLSLCSMDLYGAPPNASPSEQFASALSLFFQNPNFQNVTLKNIVFSLKMAQDVISSFVTLPCTQVQTLTFDPILLRGDDVASEKNVQKYPVPHESALQYKYLEISIREFELASNFSSWLFSMQLKLKGLAVFCHDHLHYRWNKNTHVDCLPIVAQNTCFQVESLSLCVPNGLTAAAIATILKMETLKKLKLMYCSKVIDFDELADNLLKQMPYRMFEELKIEECAHVGDFMTRSNPQTCAYFSDTLFSMPQLEDLALELSLNYRHSSSEVIETMYESWKRNSRGRKPKQLVICFLKQRYINLQPISEERRRTIKNETGLETVLDEN